MQEVFDTLPVQAEQLNTHVSRAAQQLRDFARRLELILSQDHKHIPIRDTDFPSEFAAFCTTQRQQMDQFMSAWQQLREQTRQQFTDKQYPLSLQMKSFVMRAKTLSRTADDLITAYDGFNNLYKNYTLAKLPVWVLTSVCEDLNHLVGKILFLSRETTKYAGKVPGRKNVEHK
ncbi:MAG: hypothetical protein J6U96_00195 [Elusimicrobiaceae bacterium]|nr:hypothetical protein [Elusimicrobiaceae bacterium]